MNLRQITYFLKIAELCSFTSAANALYVSQPALSKQMRQLEEELGTALFIRSDRGLKLTEAGVMLRTRAPRVLEEIAQLRNDLQASSTQIPSGSLATGMGLSVRDLITIPAVIQFVQSCPMVALHVREGITGPLVEDLKLGALDCALLFEVSPDEPLIAEPFVRESLLYIGPPGGLSLDSPVNVEQALSRPLVATGGNSPLRRRIDDAAASIGITTPLAFEVNAVEVMMGCIGPGSMHTILPYSAVHAALTAGRVSAAPIQGMHIDWSFVYARNFGLSLAARAFRDLTFQVAEQAVTSGRWQLSRLLNSQRDL
jgi:LysR family nitrogen assimilation transcriptional regulator